MCDNKDMGEVVNCDDEGWNVDFGGVKGVGGGLV